MNCINCGKEIKDNQDICLSCGAIKNKKKKKKNAINPLTIIGFILGIISAMWGILILGNANYSVPAVIAEISKVKGFHLFAEAFFTYLGMTLFSLFPALFSLICSIIGYAKKPSNMAISGTIFSAFSLGACIYILLKFIKLLAI